MSRSILRGGIIVEVVLGLQRVGKDLRDSGSVLPHLGTEGTPFAIFDSLSPDGAVTIWPVRFQGLSPGETGRWHFGYLDDIATWGEPEFRAPKRDINVG